MTTPCPNKHNHLSAFPAYDRELCPYCKQVYILKPGMALEKQLDDLLADEVMR